jgi:superfamily I DNA/RNA helicase
MLEKANSDEDRQLAEKTLEVSKVYEVYERLKRESGCVDFGDLVCLPVRLLETNADVQTLLQNQYDHIPPRVSSIRPV